MSTEGRSEVSGGRGSLEEQVISAVKDEAPWMPDDGAKRIARKVQGIVARKIDEVFDELGRK